MKKENNMTLSFLSLSENEVFARTVIAAFCLPLNPSLSQLNDIKTAVSEAVTNSVVHAYPNSTGIINMEANIANDTLHIKISDNGVGIEDVEKALEPFYTTKPGDERSGMGFTIIESFMDTVSVNSKVNCGTIIEMSKIINQSL